MSHPRARPARTEHHSRPRKLARTTAQGRLDRAPGGSGRPLHLVVNRREGKQYPLRRRDHTRTWAPPRTGPTGRAATRQHQPLEQGSSSATALEITDSEDEAAGKDGLDDDQEEVLLEITDSDDEGTGEEGLVDENQKVLQYPPGSEAMDPVTLTRGDMERLDEFEVLNDNVVDFYLKFLHVEHRPVGLVEQAPPMAIPEERRALMHIFTAHFFSKLDEAPRKRRDGEKKLTKEEEAYRRVRRWTNSLDLFSKRFVVVPIVEHFHWSVAILANLDVLLADQGKEPVGPVEREDGTEATETVQWAASEAGSEEPGGQAREGSAVSGSSTPSPPEALESENQREPCIIFMDSLQMHNENKVRLASLPLSISLSFPPPTTRAQRERERERERERASERAKEHPAPPRAPAFAACNGGMCSR